MIFNFLFDHSSSFLNRLGSSNLFFGGDVIGESAIQHLEDIGSRVKHEYFIDNRGLWDLPDLDVTIKWPYQIRPSKPDGQGKWLLYLESLPVVLGEFRLSPLTKIL